MTQILLFSKEIIPKVLAGIISKLIIRHENRHLCVALDSIVREFKGAIVTTSQQEDFLALAS